MEHEQEVRMKRLMFSHILWSTPLLLIALFNSYLVNLSLSAHPFFPHLLWVGCVKPLPLLLLGHLWQA